MNESPHFWHLVTRLGEAQIVLPAALLAAIVLLRQADARPVALWWMLLLGGASVLTTASKLAFIGWGMGWPALDFTGISGHAMFAAAVYPPLFWALLAARGPRVVRAVAVATGFALALLVGISRVMVGVHSVSEVVAGLLLGGLASVLLLGMVRLPRLSIGPFVPAVVVLFVALMSVHAPAPNTHSAVARLALLLSGNQTPHTRADMLRKQRAHAAPGIALNTGGSY